MAEEKRKDVKPSVPAETEKQEQPSEQPTPLQDKELNEVAGGRTITTYLTTNPNTNNEKDEVRVRG